jgi:hypothetical protein
MLLDPSHGALHVLASVNNGAPFTDGNCFTLAQVLKTTGNEAGAEFQIGARARVRSDGVEDGALRELRLAKEAADKEAAALSPVLGPKARHQIKR